MTLTQPIQIGISDLSRKQIAEGLIDFLSQTYGLYFKTHNFHWNVTGPWFQTLHLMFETQYTELWTATDIIAERIRALGYFVPLNLLSQSDNTGTTVARATEMIQELLKGHEALAAFIRKLLPLAEAGHDLASADLLTQRLQLHEKTAWMLRSFSLE